MTEQLPTHTAAGGNSLKINGIAEDLWDRLEERARRFGLAPAEYVRNLIRRDLEQPTLDEILAPIRQGFAESGISDDGLFALVEEVRQEIWEERRREGKV